MNPNLTPEDKLRAEAVLLAAGAREVLFSYGERDFVGIGVELPNGARMAVKWYPADCSLDKAVDTLARWIEEQNREV